MRKHLVIDRKNLNYLRSCQSNGSKRKIEFDHFEKESSNSSSIHDCNNSGDQTGHLIKSDVKGKKRFSCSICERNFVRKDTLINRFQYVHKEKTQFKCRLCKSTFIAKRSLKLHLDHLHDKKNSYGCPVCDSTFGQMGTLKLHVSRVHEEKKTHCCTICVKGFFSRMHWKFTFNKFIRKRNPILIGA